MWRDGRLLVVRKGEEFPDRCVKSNRPANGRRLQQAAETGVLMVFLLHLCNPAAGLLGHLFMKRVTFAVGLGDDWFRRRKRALFVAAAIILVSLVALAIGIDSIRCGEALGMCLVPLGILSTLGGLLYGLNASALVTTKRISNNYYWLKGVHPDFLAGLPDWPGELAVDLTPHDKGD